MIVRYRMEQFLDQEQCPVLLLWRQQLPEPEKWVGVHMPVADGQSQVWWPN
jgi:hypothetical protein